GASAVIAARRLIIARTRSTGTRSRVPARPHLPEELLDPHGVLQRTVELEAQLRDSSDVKALAQLSANERGRGRQTLQGLRLARLVPHDPDVDARVEEVRRDLDLGDRHMADTRVLDLALEDLGDLASELLSQPFDSTPCHHPLAVSHHPDRDRSSRPERDAAADQ